ncbi:amino acid transporter [Sphaerisporangium sp. NPDC005288]|uniref:Nucleotidyltransferase domain-containing protein n=1 Tax=Sphaerisporangium rhizosphaerae TaxID=2269375 RepID=A0ABW2P6N5_9ACTN
MNLFSAADGRWWIAGGYAIELAVGYGFREHGDIDVLLLRDDQLAAQRILPTWEWWCADPPGVLRPWKREEILPSTVHDIWCRPGADAPWRIQVMLDESDGPEWVSRRDSRVRRPVERLGLVSPRGVPYLRPEIQLFYKAKRPRAKDEQDFEEVLPKLGGDERRWLARTIGLVYGDHPWPDRLLDGEPRNGG